MSIWSILFSAAFGDTVSFTESPSGTIINLTSDPAIIDSLGEKWTLVAATAATRLEPR